MPRDLLEASARICVVCERSAARLTRDRCQACYARLRRGTPGPSRRLAVDVDLQKLVLPVPRISKTFATRVFGYVDLSGDCWEWTGTLDAHGYGVIGRGRRGAGNVGAHRAVWELLVGSIPDDLTYDHLCRNHCCVNPDHGEIVTLEENVRRGFGTSTFHRNRDTCKFGHPKDGMTGGRGSSRRHRYCKTCKRQKTAARYVAGGGRHA